ncbi:MAG: amidohydrolase [Faecalibacterium sp.]|nr:amidohydrolase [Faecalibacterium sp.]
MKLIDAHIHLFGQDEWADELAVSVGHINSKQHVDEWFQKLDIVHGIVMGNFDPLPDVYDFGPGYSYCVGLEGRQILRLGPDKVPAMVEEHLRRSACCGIKLYPGYDDHYLTDELYAPYYELAEKYNKPVAIHTGQTQDQHGWLKYSHPLAVDDLAVKYPNVQFILCHFGNPFLADAAAVMEKNPNVSCDISGLLEGYEDLDEYFEDKKYYIQMLQGWLSYGDYWDRVIFGTDWPGVNFPNYVEFIRRLVPRKHWQAVFFDNANRIFGLGL